MELTEVNRMQVWRFCDSYFVRRQAAELKAFHFNGQGESAVVIPGSDLEAGARTNFLLFKELQ
jgi:hypothetical protein